MADLINLQGKTRSIDIPKEIGAQWHDVGAALLNDTTDTIMPALHQTYKGNVGEINLEVLRWEGYVKLKHYNYTIFTVIYFERPTYRRSGNFRC